MVIGSVVALPMALVAVIVNVPEPDGVPEISPVIGSSVKPTGSDPLPTVNLDAGLPGATTVKLSGTPPTACGIGPRTKLGAAGALEMIVIGSVVAAGPTPLSAVMVNVPLLLGVPDNSPVTGS